MKKALIASLLALGVMGNASALTYGTCPTSNEEVVKWGWQDLDPTYPAIETRHFKMKTLWAVERGADMQIICQYATLKRLSKWVYGGNNGFYQQHRSVHTSIGHAPNSSPDKCWSPVAIPGVWGGSYKNPDSSASQPFLYNCKFPIDAW